MNENKAKVWLARDENGRLWAYTRRPSKVDNMWICSDIELELHRDCFPSVSWEDNKATEAYITLAEPQEQPKQEIDWEQRRYEIAKEMMYKIYRQEVAVSNRGQGIILKDVADIAVAFADTLIKELKEKSE